MTADRTLGTVVGLADGLPAAEHFAEATGRRLLRAAAWTDVLEAAPSCPGSLIVSGGSGVTAAELQSLLRLAAEHTVPLGFIAGWSGEKEAVQHARKIASYQWSAHEGAILWSDAAIPALQEGTHGDFQFLQELNERLIDELTRSRRCAALITHGNGVDAPLAASLLCSALRLTSLDPGASSPFLPCGYRDGPCIRTVETPEGTRVRNRVSPRDIAADVIVFFTCFGMLAAESVFDPARSLAAEFARSRRAGALLTTIQDIADDNWPAFLALGLVNAGISLGEVCRLMNVATLGSGDPGTPWILLGDPDVAFPPNRPRMMLPVSVEHDVQLRPGVSVLELPSSAPHVLAVSTTAPLPVNLLFRQVPGSAFVLAIKTGTTMDYRLLPVPADEHPHFSALKSIRGTIDPLSYAISLLDRAETNPRTRHLVQDTGLRELITARLTRNIRMAGGAIDYQLASELSGYGVEEQAENGEVTTWIALNRAIAYFLAAYALAAGTINTFSTERGKLISDDIACPYCGSQVSRREAADSVSRTRRRISWCLGCGLLGETSDQVLAVALLGPSTITPGRQAKYSLDIRGLSCEAWRVIHGCLRLYGTPWPVTLTAPMRLVVTVRGERDLSVELTMELPDGIPEGIYTLIAPVVVQGDMWITRRPVRVIADGVGMMSTCR